MAYHRGQNSTFEFDVVVYNCYLDLQLNIQVSYFSTVLVDLTLFVSRFDFLVRSIQHSSLQMKIRSSHLLDNLSNCLVNLKNSGDSTGFEPMTSAMLVQCSNQLSYEVTQWRAGQFVGLMFSRERNVI